MPHRIYGIRCRTGWQKGMLCSSVFHAALLCVLTRPVLVQAPKEGKGSTLALRVAPGAAEDEKTAQDALQAAEVGLLMSWTPSLHH